MQRVRSDMYSMQRNELTECLISENSENELDLCELLS